MKKRILIVTDSFVGEPGGSEKHLLNLLTGIDKSFDVIVYQMNPFKKDLLLNNEYLNEKRNVILHYRPVYSVFSFAYFSLLCELFRLVRKNKIHLLISYHEKADLLNFLLKKITFRPFVSLSSKRDLGFDLTERIKKLMAFIMKYFDGAVSPSKSIRDMLISDYGVKPEASWLIHNGTNLSLYNSVSAEENVLLRKKLGLPVGKIIIGCVGTIKKIKGHKFLIEGFNQYRKSNASEVQLVFIGGSEGEGDGEGARLKKLVDELGMNDVVTFAGVQTNVADWLKAFDLFAIPSLSEGLSNALVEASAAGLPLLATDVGGNGEIVEQGRNGFLVEAGSSDSIAEALKEILGDTNRLKEFGVWSRRLAEEKFSNEGMIKSFEDVFSRLITAKGFRD